MMHLDLKFPIQREQDRVPDSPTPTLNYTTGTNCVLIERDPGGGWWLSIAKGGHRRYWIPDDSVALVLEVPDRYNQGDAPSYAVPVESAGAEQLYTCKLCKWGPGKLHALRIHHGKTHGESR